MKCDIEKDFRARIGALSEAFGPSGFEEDIVKLIQDDLKESDFSFETDLMQNLIVHKKGKGSKKVLIAAHTDEIGLIVRTIDSRGFLWVETLGGIAPQQFFGKHVRVKTEDGRYVDGIVNATKPGRPERCTTMPTIHDFFVEVGAESRQEVLDMGIEVGSPISIDYPVIPLGKYRVGGKALDDRALDFILEELVLLLKDDEDIPDLYAVFTSQEEVGARGAIVATKNIEPDVAIALDMSLATDIPGVPESAQINAIGKGTSIKVMDKLSTGMGGILANHEIVKLMKKVCKEQSIPFQIEAYAAGATDASFMQTLNKGIQAGGIQLPMRYVHSYEVVDVRDVVDTVNLLFGFVKAFG